MTPADGVLWVVEARVPCHGDWHWDHTSVFGSRERAEIKCDTLRRRERMAEYRVVRYVREDQP